MSSTVAGVVLAVTLSTGAFASVAQEMSCERIRGELQFWSRQYALQRCIGAPASDARCQSVMQFIQKYSQMYRGRNCSAVNRSAVDEDGFRID